MGGGGKSVSKASLLQGSLDALVPNMGQWQPMKAARNGGDDGKTHDEKGICDDSMHSRGRNSTRLQCLERRQSHVDLDARR